MIKANLTPSIMAAILTPLSTHLEAGFRSPHSALIRPLLTVVFLYPSKTQFNFVMVGCIEQPLKRLAAPVGTTNFDTFHRPTVNTTGRRLIPFTWKVLMNNTNIPAQTEQPITLDKLHNAFAEVCHSYGDLNHYYGISQYVDSKRVDWMQEAIKSFSKEVEALRYGGAK